MPKTSAGLLLYRRVDDALEVLLVHPGGPYWARKDEGVWSVPKGEYEADEDPLEVARREFEEELGAAPPDGTPSPLGEIRQSGGKVVTAWAQEGNLDVTHIRSNTFEMEWPPRSGRTQAFPEVDAAAWFPIDEARKKLNRGQVPFLDRLSSVADEG
jgi:predicted NUDIX family NTP pyrophosphohydrolase